MKQGFKKPSKKVSERMRRVKSSDTNLEKAMEKILRSLHIEYEKQPNLEGHPDFRIEGTNILIFCDSSFWHGRRESEITGKAFKKNREFWTKKLIENKKRDQRINRKLRKLGWSVQRFWDTDILKKPDKVKNRLRRIMMKRMGKPLTAIDLFCGAGGLTLGLKRAGFKVVAGVEINPEIAKTYKANHLEVKLLTKDVREVAGEEVFNLIGKHSIDLVAGCPPCQGFSKLTDKYHREDPRNDLVLEMARLIEETSPRMVMMENVPGLANRGKPILDEFVKRLKKLGYIVNMDVLQVADYGVPQSRKRLVLLAGKGFEIPLPRPTHCRTGDEKKGLKTWLTLADVIKNMPKPVTLSHAKKRGGPKKFNWHIVSDLKEISIKRLKALDSGDSRGSLPKKLRPKCHKNSNEGFQNVYGRLDWNQTPPTITSGCTTTAMGRFGHPNELRTISIREAALIQTFPMNYEFDTEFMSTAQDLVGNALPCLFAKKVATTCMNAFTSQNIESVK